jgi:hypothetical protein
MKSPRLVRIIREKLEDESHWLTRRKLAIIGVTLILSGPLLTMLAPTREPERVLHTETIRLLLPEEEITGGAATYDPWHSVTVRSGQTLDAIFREQGFSIALLHRILAMDSATKG